MLKPYMRLPTTSDNAENVGCCVLASEERGSRTSCCCCFFSWSLIWRWIFFKSRLRPLYVRALSLPALAASLSATLPFFEAEIFLFHPHCLKRYLSWLSLQKAVSADFKGTADLLKAWSIRGIKRVVVLHVLCNVSVF